VLARRRRPVHRPDDPRVTATPAHARFQRRPDLSVRGIWVTGQQRRCPQRHAGGAVPALEGALFRQRLLHRVQAAGGCEPFDRGDRPARHLREPGLAGQRRDAVDEHRAGTALALAAARFRAGQAKISPQQREQAPGG
jgi:hypothetical protein